MIGNKLKYGDTIGLVAPAGVEKAERIEKGISKLEELGFKIKKGKSIYDRWGYFAGSDEDRARDIMNMFEDEDVDMILCVRGGYGAMRIMPYLDFNLIAKNPKVFMGYSDITILLNTIYARTRMITFHGPMLNSDFTDEHTLNSFIKTIMEGDMKFSIKNPCGIPTVTNSNRCAAGKLVGGNLSLICSSMGTPYEINTKNNILFIEEVGEAPYKIDRMLTQLTLSGKLQHCSGIILGQFTDCDDSESGFNLKEVIEDRILSLNIPTLLNFSCGHDNPKLVLPIGSNIRLNCRTGEIEVMEKVVK
jgi:muramoyltetrapeptide carboxypeptidase